MDNKNAVLLVDDDVALLKAVGEILKNDYTVSSVKSGREALEILKTGYIPDIILMDVDMPGFNGFETLPLIREIDSIRDIPVMFLTGLAMTESEVRGINSGAVDYITKPFVNENLMARMKQHLENGRRLRMLRMLEKSMNAGFNEEKFAKIASGLTETERKVLRLIALGYNNREIGDALHYSVNYVKNVVSVIYEKNHVGNRSGMKRLLQ